MKEKGQKLKICAKKARTANKRRVAFLAKIATRWIYFIHIFRQLLVPNLSKSEQKNSVLALGAYYTDYQDFFTPPRENVTPEQEIPRIGGYNLRPRKDLRPPDYFRL